MLGAVHIEGATVFSPAVLAEDFEPYLATEVDDARLKEITARITRRYRAAGYVLSYAVVPAQDVRGGIVRIDVVEGHVGNVEVVGDDGSNGKIAALAAPLLRDRPLRSSTLERAIGLMRDLPGILVTDVQISRSPGDPSSHALRILVARDAFRALAYADNRGTDANGRIRFYASGSASSLVTTGDDLRVDLFGIPGDHYRYLYAQIAASTPIGNDGLRFGVSASSGDQKQTISGFRLDGQSRNIAANLSYPIVRSRAFTATVKFSLNDWRSSDALDRVRIQRDRLRVARIGLAISAVSTRRFDAEFSLARGLDFDGVTRAGDPLATRRDASGRFTKANFTLQLTNPISDKVTLSAAMAGQYSANPLLSVEEFAIGGSQIGRAYDFNALTGDHGIGGGLELGYRIGDTKFGPRQLQIFGYIDGGAAFQDGNRSGLAKRRSLASIGAGNRFSIAGISFSMEIGVPLLSGPRGKGVRGFLTAAKQF